MKILLMCAGGMSTSLLVKNMEQAAIGRNISDLKISAISVENLEFNLNEYDVFLIGPQIRYREDEIRDKVEAKNKKWANIPPQVYGRVDGKAALELAVNLIK